jgi:hypothetical protein
LSRRALSVVEGVQVHLEAIYDLEVGHRATDFLLDEGGVAALREAGHLDGERQPDEQVLLIEDDAGLSLGVYLSEAVRGRLAAGHGLAEHCHVTEGVSHFLLLLWSAQEGRRVRGVDLELQAEVDKAATVLLMDRAHRGGSGGRELLRRLFDGATLEDDLNEPERQRYRAAHRLGRRYSARLADLLDQGVDHLLGELRGFYRLPWDARLARAAA